MRGFYGRWVVANGVAEAAGLGTTFVLGTALAPRLAAASGVAEILGGAALAVLLGTFLEGVVVGWAQGRVLAVHLPVSVRAWVRASAVGAGLAWLLGMVPSTVVSLVMLDAPAAAPGALPPAEPGPWLTMLLAAGLGLVTGPVLGAAQWQVLRQVAPGGRRWLWANALAWAVGMPLIFAGMDRVPWQGPAPARVAALYGVCLVAGLAVGAVHGRVLAPLAAAAGRPGAPAPGPPAG
jgi:hypothetical protein